MVIEDLTVETMQLLVDFLYGVFKPQMTFSQAEQLFMASDKYCIHYAYHACIKALKTHLYADPTLLLPLATLADRHSCLPLIQVLILCYIFQGLLLSADLPSAIAILGFVKAFRKCQHYGSL